MKQLINRERLISTFIDLAKISSPSWEEKGVIEFIQQKAQKLGVSCALYPCKNSFNVLIHIPGESSYVPVLFSAHMDTVTPCENIQPVVKDNRIVSDGRTILGADDKSAIAAFLEAIEILKENSMPHGHIEFLFSCAEEVGLFGIKGFDLSQVKARYAFVFDSDGPVGKIIVAAPYHISMKIAVKGKAAHAGMEPEKGVSAIRVLSEIIHAIPHGRIDKETTANVGIIKGGRATNIVAEEAECTLETRSRQKSKVFAVKKEIENIAKNIAKNHKAKVNIDSTMDYEGYTIREEDTIVAIASKALKSIGIKPLLAVSGGGSDTNIFNTHSIPAVNLSSGMRQVHTTKEYITIPDLVNVAALVLSIIENAKR
ncbi:MAG: M20/M25/M40 family metallo-hydrolase [Spirochaetes bacterium]|nr:M20/M25/M40 family metallo-hydrolase [Spirochaetota bacterium]